VRGTDKGLKSVSTRVRGECSIYNLITCGGGGVECPTQHTASLTRPGSLPARPGKAGQYITEKQARHGGPVRWREIGLRRREGGYGAGMAPQEKRPNRTRRVNFCKTGTLRERRQQVSTTSELLKEGYTLRLRHFLHSKPLLFRGGF
jgi:hypothetical protein